MPTSLQTTYISPESARTPLDLLDIERTALPSYAGIVTSSQVVRYLRHVLYGLDPEPTVDCGMQPGGGMEVGIIAWPAYPELAYQMYTSYGTLSERTVDFTDISEIVDVPLQTTVTPKHHPLELVSAVWQGDVYDANLTVTSQPTITISGDEILLSSAVYGTLAVTYKAVRHLYTLTTTPREDASMDLLGAVVYGVYTGGIKWLDITPPEWADAIAKGEADCGYGNYLESGGGPGEDPYTPGPYGANREIVKNYCDQLTISDQTYET